MGVSGGDTTLDCNPLEYDSPEVNGADELNDLFDQLNPEDFID